MYQDAVLSKPKEAYRNPDTPADYQQKIKPELKYQEGIEIDGVHCRFLGTIINSGIFEEEDIEALEKLDELIFNSSEDEEIKILSPEPTKREGIEIIDLTTDEPESNQNTEVKTLGALKTEIIDVEDEQRLNKKKETKTLLSPRAIKEEVIDVDEEPVPNRRKGGDHVEKYSKRERRKEYEEQYNKRERRQYQKEYSKRERKEERSKRERKKKYEKEYNQRERRKEYEGDYGKRVMPKFQLEKSDDYYGHSDSSNDSDRRYEKKRYSRSPPPQPKTQNVKEIIVPEHLFGSYPCDICHISMNSLSTYNTHINGKKHLKVLKKCQSETASNILPNVVPNNVLNASKEGLLKYPTATGVIRKKVKELAKIQDTIDKLEEPSPGLYEVIEIQAIRETQYYCGICDSLCSSNSIIPHLKGYKHRWKSLKYFKPSVYAQMISKSKKEVEKIALKELQMVQEKEGRGRMAVEREEFICNPKDIGTISSHPSTSVDMPSTSHQNFGMSFSDYEMINIPEPSKSPYYCRVCESHMNCETMWRSHIRGKRHLANNRKNTGEPFIEPLKSSTFSLHKNRAYLFDQIDCINEPIIGLDQVQEIQFKESRLVKYQCFLCGVSASPDDIVEHLTNQKHMLKYLEFLKHPELGVLNGMSDSDASTRILQIAKSIEDEAGRGNPSVNVTKRK